MTLNKLAEKILVAISESRNPKDFFKDRDGLLVYGSFEERIVAKAEQVEVGKEFNLSSFELTERSSDKTIEDALGGKHLFSETEVSAIVAELISKQSKGEEGALLTNGYANLFYTPPYVVSVRWYAGGWDVGAWDRDDGKWGVGRRVFSPATDL